MGFCVFLGFVIVELHFLQVTAFLVSSQISYARSLLAGSKFSEVE